MAKIVREFISPPEVYVPRAPKTQAVRVDNTVYISGQLGIEKETFQLVSGGAVPEARLALKNLGDILTAAKSSFGNVVKTTLYLDDMNDFQGVNEVYREFFEKPYPARACVETRKLPMGAKVEIDAIAVVGEVITITN